MGEKRQGDIRSIFKLTTQQQSTDYGAFGPEQFDVG